MTSENNYSQHARLLEVSTNIFASVDENAEINVTMNTTGICQWCLHLKQCNNEKVQRRLVKETSF